MVCKGSIIKQDGTHLHGGPEKVSHYRISLNLIKTRQ